MCVLENIKQKKEKVERKGDTEGPASECRVDIGEWRGASADLGVFEVLGLT